MDSTIRTQAVVVGGGIAGLLAARALVRLGVDCHLVEALLPEELHCSYEIEIDSRTIMQQIIPPPRPEARVPDRLANVEYLTPSGRAGCSVSPLAVWGIRLWSYMDQLRLDLKERGVPLHYGWRLAGLTRGVAGGTLAVCQSDRGTHELVAPLVVMAVGLGISQWKAVLEEEFGLLVDIEDRDLLDARFQGWTVDPTKIQAGDFPGPPGTMSYVMGRYGAMSTAGLGLHSSGRHASVLLGTVPSDGAPAAVEAARQFVSGRQGLGALEFEGGGSIPIRRPLTVLARNGVALVGASACQVMPLSASGVALTGRAANQLAKAAKAGVDSGRMEDALWDYNVEYHRHYGGMQAFAQCLVEGFRQSPRDGSWVEELLSSGLMSSGEFRRGLALDLMDLPPIGDVLAKVSAISRRPSHWKLTGMVSRGWLAYHAHRHLYPKQSDSESIGSFHRLIGRLVGPGRAPSEIGA